jgi:hypothetical protein
MQRNFIGVLLLLILAILPCARLGNVARPEYHPLNGALDVLEASAQNENPKLG